MHKIKLIAGLGNPGKDYENTRHNAGFKIVDFMLKENDANWNDWSGLAKLSKIALKRKFMLAKPLKFMNNSGPVLRKICGYYNILPDEILVLLDDFSLPFGKLRLRRSGSSGGHNGMESVISHLGTQEVPRLRIGIGPVPDRLDPADFVLSSFNSSEKKQLKGIIETAAEVVEDVINEGMEKAVSKIGAK
jgi:PTH1 family peptidyl-tRNA hydrolase